VSELTALIDGDIIVYRAAFACQKTVYTHVPTGEFFTGKQKANDWLVETLDGPEKGVRAWIKEHWNEEDWEMEVIVEPINNLHFLINKFIEDIMKETGAVNYQVYLSPRKCFRHEIATVKEYKSGRPEGPKLKHSARKFLLDFYDATVPENLEADDAMGMAQTTTTVICSNDKDLQQVPGRHYNFVTDEHMIVDMYEADCWFFTQLLSGDAVDAIPGLPGIADKKARKIVDEFAGAHKELVEYVKQLYVDNYGPEGEEIMKEMAQLVYILRPGDTFGTEQWRDLLEIQE